MLSSLYSDVPFSPAQRSFLDAKLYLLALAFALGNLLLPMAVHAMPQGGLIFLPLFFFTLVAAYAEGLNAGLLVALASPLLNTALTGMPPLGLLPLILLKSLFIAIAAALSAARLRRISLPAIAGLVLAMQALGALAEWALLGSLAGALRSAWLGIPGMLIMSLGGYALLRWVARLRNKEGQAL
jgi:hypothetical protein